MTDINKIEKMKPPKYSLEELLDITFPMNTDLSLLDGDSRGIKQRFRDLFEQYGQQQRELGRNEAIDYIRGTSIWKLVPNVPRMIMCNEREFNDLLGEARNLKN